MKTFTGYQYLLIDAANNFNANLDKLTFETRIDWAKTNLDTLEQLAEGAQWKNKPMYLKAVQTIRKAQRGEPTGHLVGLDAVCSGMQIMSVLTGCIKGAAATGLINPNVRSDAYSECTDIMNNILGTSAVIPREDVKQAVMTSLYGSKKEPEKLFGEDTKELEAFKKAMMEMAPGAVDLLQALIESWQPYDTMHSWTLPDGFQARVKVMQRKEHRIEVDEIGHSSFTYVYYENKGKKRDVKNAANVIHSVDAYILRSLVRRCSYDYETVAKLSKAISAELLDRDVYPNRSYMTSSYFDSHFPETSAAYNASIASGIVDISIVPLIIKEDISSLAGFTTVYLRQLNRILSFMLAHPPFEIVTVHDDFRAHPNNLDALRLHYKSILADIAGSTLAQDLLSQIHGQQGHYTKQGHTLRSFIEKSNYALC